MDYFDILLARNLANKGDITTESLSVTENGTYTAPSGKAYTPVTVEVQPPANSYQLKSITTPTSLATFDASALPMPSLKVSVEAKQDLHGYDHPWVGGAGKNKAESVINDWSNKGITATKNDDGSYSITGTATESVTSAFLVNVYPVSDGEQYIVTNKKNQADTATKYTRCVCSFYNDSTYKSEINVSEGQTITVPSNVNRLRLSYVWNNGFVVPAGAIIYPMVRLSTETDATFAPYSNVCPISGWDEANISDVGKNVLPLTLENLKAINASGTWNNNVYTLNDITWTVEIADGLINGITASGTSRVGSAIYLANDFTYNQGVIMSGCPSGGASNKYNINWVNNGDDIGEGVTVNEPTAGNVRIRIVNNVTVSDLLFKPMIRLSSDTDATFEPYNPDSYTTTISLGQTVYGGEVDVVNGILKITDGYIASYNGETLPSTWISSMDVYAEGTTPTTGAEVCYELANPIIINLTPTLIKSLNGINNLSVDCGDVIEGEYFKAL